MVHGMQRTHNLYNSTPTYTPCIHACCNVKLVDNARRPFMEGAAALCFEDSRCYLWTTLGTITSHVIQHLPQT